MDDSHLPVEMCEHIIDSLYHYYGSGLYHTALVCSAWLPRSRFNMYRAVVLGHTPVWRVNCLFRTLEENPHLAHLVIRLQVWTGLYTSFTRFAPLLKNCVILSIYGNWMPYPPRFADTCLFPFSLLGIVKLELMLSKSSAGGLLRFIPSLKMLEELAIDVNSDMWGMGPIAARSARSSRIGMPAALSKLKNLQLKVRNIPEQHYSYLNGFHSILL